MPTKIGLSSEVEFDKEIAACKAMWAVFANFACEIDFVLNVESWKCNFANYFSWAVFFEAESYQWKSPTHPFLNSKLFAF